MPDPDPPPANPYGTVANRNKAETIKNQLRSLYMTLKLQVDETKAQVSLAKELKTDLHITRFLDHHAEAKATMFEITRDNIGKLVTLGEPDGSPTMVTYNTWEGLCGPFKLGS